MTNLIFYVDHKEGMFGHVESMTLRLEKSDGTDGRITYFYDGEQPEAEYEEPLTLMDVATVQAVLVEQLEKRDLEMFHDAFLDSEGHGSRDRVLTY